MTEVIRAPSSFSVPVASSGALDELEYGRVLELVARRAVSDLGARAVRARRPTDDAQWIVEELAAAAELARVLVGGDEFTPEAVPELSGVLETLGTEGGVLDPEGLLALARTLVAAATMAPALRDLRDDAPRVARLAVDPPPRSLARAIDRAVEPDGTFRDEASSDLAGARRRLRDTRTRLIRLLRSILRDSGAEHDAEVTLRGDRYVIPVRRDDRERVRGIVHGESASGTTLFVEPTEAVELGNALNACRAEEARAIQAVLRDLTRQAREHREAVRAAWLMCVRADELYARARYMRDTDAAVPEMRTDSSDLVIANGRHPLLLAEGGEPVPFALVLGDGERTLVVSGPNAGGKTVLLKAVGLTAALAQAGIVPPVGTGTRLPVFRRVFVDIGDHQSIAANLSTFSAHLAALRDVLAGADGRSLVLLDELGGGTDPTEGAALAGAVLLALTDRAAVTVATTHLNQLKELAAQSDGVVNASLEFDVETLEPTYRLVLGRPGRSYGLQIARRLGLPQQVLEAAERLTPEAMRTLEATLKDLETREAALREREDAAARREGEGEAERVRLARDRSDLERRLEAVRAREVELERAGREQARRFLLEARRRVEEALGVARAAVSEATAKEARRLVEEGVQEEAEALAKLEAQAREKGWTIRLGKKGETGKRKRETGTAAGSGTPGDSSAGDLSLFPLPVSLERASSEIDLRGMRADDAEAAVLAALDDAVVADLPSLRIIHGKGTGALRARVREVLQGDGRVQAFRPAPPTEGGAGVTIAELGS